MGLVVIVFVFDRRRDAMPRAKRPRRGTTGGSKASEFCAGQLVGSRTKRLRLVRKDELYDGERDGHAGGGECVGLVTTFEYRMFLTSEVPM